ncbi:MAG TPA: hypothetical protein VJA84_03955 [Candidatus Omnitrophota bacterium]|nr:hypothetical protein [Candidatus Omnitrophota bacterium]
MKEKKKYLIEQAGQNFFVTMLITTFKKNLIIRILREGNGQAVIEYIIIFIAITLVVAGFISKAHNTDRDGIMDNHFQDMVKQTLG